MFIKNLGKQRSSYLEPKPLIL